MTNPPPITYPAGGAPRITWLPAALMGFAAVIGLLGTLLPIWSLSLSPADLRPGSGFIADDEAFQRDIEVSVGFYSWTAANLPFAAAIPLALAVAAAVAVATAVLGANRTFWGGTVALGTCAIALTISVAIRPTPTTAITGSLASELSPRDLNSLGTVANDVGVNFGSGLMIALASLIAVLVIAMWQYLSSIRLGPATRSQTQSP